MPYVVHADFIVQRSGNLTGLPRGLHRLVRAYDLFDCLRVSNVDASSIFEGIHLFRNNICLFPYSARKKRCLFKNRRADIAEAVSLENIAGSLLDVVPHRAIGRKDIARAFNGAELPPFAHGRNFPTPNPRYGGIAISLQLGIKTVLCSEQVRQKGIGTYR